MTAKVRLAKLEQLLSPPQAEPARIGRFIVEPGNLQPDAYHCNGLDFHRQDGEPHRAFTLRCIGSFDVGGDRLLFLPIEAHGEH